MRCKDGRGWKDGNLIDPPMYISTEPADLATFHHRAKDRCGLLFWSCGEGKWCMRVVVKQKEGTEFWRITTMRHLWGWRDGIQMVPFWLKAKRVKVFCPQPPIPLVSRCKDGRGWKDGNLIDPPMYISTEPADLATFHHRAKDRCGLFFWSCGEGKWCMRVVVGKLRMNVCVCLMCGILCWTRKVNSMAFLSKFRPVCKLEHVWRCSSFLQCMWHNMDLIVMHGETR